MHNFAFSSWQGVLSTLVVLAIFTLIGVGIRVLMMLAIQQRRERMTGMGMRPGMGRSDNDHIE